MKLCDAEIDLGVEAPACSGTYAVAYKLEAEFLLIDGGGGEQGGFNSGAEPVGHIAVALRYLVDCFRLVHNTLRSSIAKCNDEV